MKSLASIMCLIVVAAAGCGSGGPPQGTVSGKVTIGGALPPEPVRVSFINSIIGQGAAATTAADGSYRLDHPIHVAEYTVYFEKVVTSSGPVSTKDETLTAVPKEYRSEASSPLKHSVKQGANTIDLEVPSASAKSGK